MRSLKIIIPAFFIVSGLAVKAQTSVNPIRKTVDTKVWYLQDSATDFVDGISLNKAYDFLKKKINAGYCCCN